MLAEIRGNQAKGSDPTGVPAFIEYPLLLVQLCIFAILYAIWVLPGTIALRNVCLVLGAILSLYPIFRARKLLLQKSAIPIWLIIALFGWVIFHLLFLSQDPVLQYEEFTSIWKRAAIGVIFAFGMGLSIGRIAQADQTKRRWFLLFWIVFYVGLFAPTLIYLTKLFLTSYGWSWGIQVPEWAKLYFEPHAFYVPKTAYVAFCMPVFAVALGSLLRNLSLNRWFVWDNFLYLATLTLVFTVFYYENIKNGVAYGLALGLIFLCLLIASVFTGRWFAKITLVIVIIAASSFFLSLHIQKNDSWKTFWLDAKVAFNTGQNQQWKYGGAKGFPLDERGRVVSITNYERIAWAKEGFKLIIQNPLGYGLVERSFGHLASGKWPDSKLNQSHSGWIDLTLGIGIPGVALLFGSILLLINSLGSSSPNFKFSNWVFACRWALLCLLLMWCTTEISQKVYLDSLIFLVALVSGINLGLTNKKSAPSFFYKCLVK